MIIFAVNIHTGGGKILLDEILAHKTFGPVTAAYVDSRYSLPQDVNFPVYKSRGRLWGRVRSELALHQLLKTKPDEILFFGNLPPLLKPHSIAFLYLQNCFLTRQVPLPQDSIQEKLRNWLESKWLKRFSKNVSEIWVQTPWMKTQTERYLPNSNVRIKAFLPALPTIRNGTIRDIDFLFVGSLALNKRLSFFYDALKILDQKILDQKILKKMAVEVILDSQGCEKLKPAFQKIDLRIVHQLSRPELFKKYEASKNFVTTSRYESYCLPLYEAQHFGCQIIAPRAGYTENLNFKFSAFALESTQDLADRMFDLLPK